MINNLRFLTFDGEIDFSKIDYNGTEITTSSIYFPKTSVGLYETKTIVPLENVVVNSQGLSSEQDVIKLTPTLEYPTHNLKFKILQEGNSNHFFIAYVTQDEQGDPVVNFLDEIYLKGTVTKDTVLVNVNKEFSNTVDINKTIDKNGYIAKEYETKEYSIIEGDLIQRNSILKGQGVVIGCFSSEEKSAAGSLIISDIDETGAETIISFINLYAEFEGEDERLTTLLDNLGYTLPEEDNFIFNETDVNEELTDWILLNEKRKELLLEGHNIKPFIGTYKAVVNAIKFYGYDDLRLKEYWYDTNTNKLIADDVEYYGGTSKLKKPSKNLKKTNMFSLNYRINNPTGTYDVWDIPNVEETSQYTIDEILIKLYGLKKRLEKTYLPANVKIIDITAEGDYFDQVAQSAWTNQHKILTVGAGKEASFDTYPKNQNRKLFIEDLRHVSKRFSYQTPDSILEFKPNHLTTSDDDSAEHNYNHLISDYELYANAPNNIPNQFPNLESFFKDFRTFPLNSPGLENYSALEAMLHYTGQVDQNEESFHNYMHKSNPLVGSTVKKENIIKDGRLYNKYVFGYIPNFGNPSRPNDELFYIYRKEDNVNLFTFSNPANGGRFEFRLFQDKAKIQGAEFVDEYYNVLQEEMPDVSFPEFNGLYVYEQNKESFNLNTYSNLDNNKWYIFKAKLKIDGTNDSVPANELLEPKYGIHIEKLFDYGEENLPVASPIAFMNTEISSKYFGDDYEDFAFAFKPENDNANVRITIAGELMEIKSVSIKDVELYEADYNAIEYDIRAFYDHYYDVRKSTHTNLKSTPIGCPLMSYCDSLTDEWNDLRGTWNDYEDVNNTSYKDKEFMAWYLATAGDSSNLSLNEYYVPSTTLDANDEQVLDKFADEYLRMNKYNTWTEYENGLRLKLKGLSGLTESQLKRVKKEDTLYCWDNIWKNGIVDIEWTVTYVTGSNLNASQESTNWGKTFRGRIEDFHKIYYVLPFVGKYNLEMKLYDANNVCSSVIKKEEIEVCQKNVEIYAWTPWIYGQNDLESEKIDKITDVDSSVASFYHSLDRNNYIHDEKNGYEFSTCYYRKSANGNIEMTTGPYFWSFLKTHNWNDGSRMTWDNTIIAGDEPHSFTFNVSNANVIRGGKNLEARFIVREVLDNGKVVNHELDYNAMFDGHFHNFFNDVIKYSGDAFFEKYVSINPILSEDETQITDLVVIVDKSMPEPPKVFVSLKYNNRPHLLSGIRASTFGMHNPTYDGIKIIKTHDYIKLLNHCVFSFDYSNVPGITNHSWTIRNKTTKTSDKYSKDEYLTYLFNEKGTINIGLELEDSNGNLYKYDKDILTII